MCGISFVALVSDSYMPIFEKNLNISPAVSDLENNELIIIRNFSLKYPCKSLNEAIGVSRNDVIVFVQADVYLPVNWDYNLLRKINEIQDRDYEWGVIGIFGVSNENRFVGNVYSNGLEKELGEPHMFKEAKAIDETLFVLNKKTGITFDDKFPNLYLYGNDLLNTASKGGYKNLIVSNFLVHNSLTQVRPPSYALESIEYFRRKWKNQLPFYANYVTVYPEKWKNYYSYIKNHFYSYYAFRRNIVTRRHTNPQSIKSKHETT